MKSNIKISWKLNSKYCYAFLDSIFCLDLTPIIYSLEILYRQCFVGPLPHFSKKNLAEIHAYTCGHLYELIHLKNVFIHIIELSYINGCIDLSRIQSRVFKVNWCQRSIRLTVISTIVKFGIMSYDVSHMSSAWSNFTHIGHMSVGSIWGRELIVVFIGVNSVLHTFYGLQVII